MHAYLLHEEFGPLDLYEGYKLYGLAAWDFQEKYRYQFEDTLFAKALKHRYKMKDRVWNAHLEKWVFPLSLSL